MSKWPDPTSINDAFQAYIDKSPHGGEYIVDDLMQDIGAATDTRAKVIPAVRTAADKYEGVKYIVGRKKRKTRLQFTSSARLRTAPAPVRPARPTPVSKGRIEALPSVDRKTGHRANAGGQIVEVTLRGNFTGRFEIPPDLTMAEVRAINCILQDRAK